MRTLPRYILRLFLGRAVAAVAGLTALLLVFDILANAGEIVARGAGVFVPLGHYAALRAPEVATLVTPLAALLAAMMTYAHLVTTSEMIAARAAGVSLRRVMGAVLVGAAVVAVAHGAFQQFVAQDTSARLRLWAERDYQGAPPSMTPQRAPAWFAAGDALVHADSSTPDGRRLDGVTVVRRDPQGRLIDLFDAAWADFSNGFWRFHEVARLIEREAGAPTTRARLDLVLPISPKRFSTLAESADELGLGELWRLHNTPDAGSRPDSFYSFWLQRKIAQPVGALVLVLIAAPIALQAARRNRLLLASFGTVTAGFLFFVSERVLAALGETGLLPATIAAWTPAAVFSLLALWVVVTLEG